MLLYFTVSVPQSYLPPGTHQAPLAAGTSLTLALLVMSLSPAFLRAPPGWPSKSVPAHLIWAPLTVHTPSYGSWGICSPKHIVWIFVTSEWICRSNSQLGNVLHTPRLSQQLKGCPPQDGTTAPPGDRWGNWWQAALPSPPWPWESGYPLQPASLPVPHASWPVNFTSGTLMPTQPYLVIRSVLFSLTLDRAPEDSLSPILLHLWTKFRPVTDLLMKQF